MKAAIFLLVLWGFLASAQNSDVIVKNLKLFVNGEEYWIKGMCYNPVPLGENTVDKKTFTGGGGLCSVKRTPYGEWYSACHDSDYFDGSPDSPARYPPGPPSWFRTVWERDFPILKDLGVNTIRIYNANPTTRQASLNDPTLEPYGKDHVPFMDLAQQWGLKVIFPLVGDYNLMMNTPEDKFLKLLENQIDEVGNHPALLMWTMGNELPLANDKGLLDKINKMIAYARGYTLLRWRRQIPITHAVVDLPGSYNFLAENLDVDVFTSNAGYRGWDFSDFWTGPPNNADFFAGWKALSCMHAKPMFIGEFGWLGENNAPDLLYPNWFNSKLNAMVANTENGCIGGAMFEYSDEPLKADPQQQTLGVCKFVPQTMGAQNSLMQDVFMADDLQKKALIYDSVKSGQWENKDVNFNSDIFQLLGRPAFKVGDTMPNICAGIVKTCPGTPSCNGNGDCNMAVDPPVCVCKDGWRGSACNFKMCPGDFMPCTGRGLCDTTKNPPVCTCNTGFSGLGCEEPPLSTVIPTSNPGTNTGTPSSTTSPNPNTGGSVISGASSSIRMEHIAVTVFAIILFSMIFANRQ